MSIFVGTTIAEAKDKALAQLKPTASQRVTVKVIQQPRHGFLGIGRREAKIDVTFQETAPVKAAPAKKLVPVKEIKANAPSKEPLTVASGELDPAEIKRRQKANRQKTATASQELVTYLTQVFRELGVVVTPKITSSHAHEVTIDLVTTAPGRVIGKHGRRINALEQLATAFMSYHGAAKVTVTLDTANYRQRRQETVSRLAERAAMEVLASGQAVFMDPMPARERKQIHQKLENNSRVKTYSHGREPFRSIVVAPKN